MINKPYNILYVSLREFSQYFDIEVNSEQQVGVFKNETIKKCHEIVTSGVVPPLSIIAYRNEHTGKLVSVHQSDMINHILALAYPKAMGINIDRTIFNFIPRLSMSTSTSIFMCTSDWLRFLRECDAAGATEEEKDRIEMIIGKFGGYKLPVFEYSTYELAHLAASIS